MSTSCSTIASGILDQTKITEMHFYFRRLVYEHDLHLCCLAWLGWMDSVTFRDPETSRLAINCHRKVSLRHADLHGSPPNVHSGLRIPTITCKKNRAQMDSIFLGWDGGIRTPECRHQKPMPYHLATSH